MVLGRARVNRSDLREQWRHGSIDRDAYGASLREMHRDLEDYSAFLRGSAIAGITVTEMGVTLRSRFAPVDFHCDFDDLRTPPMVALACGTYEPLEMRSLLLMLEGAGTFIDAGANLGWYSLHAAAAFPNLRILAFEPGQKASRQLAANVELNQASVRAIRMALADRPGELSLHVSPTRSDAASVNPSRRYAGQVAESITATTLDTVAQEQGLVVDVLKADVEGGELSLLRGGLRTLERDRPAVLAEMLRLHSAPFGYHPNDIVDLMAGLGYQCFADQGQQWQPFTFMDAATEATNFLFLNPDRHATTLQSLTDDGLMAGGPPPHASCRADT